MSLVCFVTQVLSTLRGPASRAHKGHLHLPRFACANSTLFHELIHSTGHESRLARTFGVRFGDDQYSKEELIAETGAAFLATIAGISTEDTEKNTAAYIQNWIKALEGDSRLIITAAAAAQKAADVILGTHLEDENNDGRTEQAEGADATGALAEEFTQAA